MRILLVDSDTEARTAIVLWLDEFFAHVEIEAAASAAEAVIALQKSMPDLVITAHAIPGLDGIALASIVKSRPNPPPVVVLSTGCGGGVDLWIEKRHLQAVLLDFLQRRFPETWARSVAQRTMARAH
jgi:CheY-like chemotaxis protein